MDFMFKDPSQLQVDFGVSSFSYNTNSSLSLMDNSEYLQLVHSQLEKATELWGVRIVDTKLKHLCLWFHMEIDQDSESEVHVW